jgi:ferredoxin
MGSRVHIEVDETRCRTVGECVKACSAVFHFTAGSKKAGVDEQKIQDECYEHYCWIASLCPTGAIRVYRELGDEERRGK